MRMCIAEEGWSRGIRGLLIVRPRRPNAPAVPVPTVPRACVLYSTTIYDLGDGYVSRDF